jgi:hypothetical protein
MMNVAATPMAVAPTAMVGAELFELPRAVRVPQTTEDGRRPARPPEPPRLRSSTADVLVGDGGLVMTSCVVAGLARAAIAKIVVRVKKRTMMVGVGFDGCNLLSSLPVSVCSEDSQSNQVPAHANRFHLVYCVWKFDSATNFPSPRNVHESDLFAVSALNALILIAV